MEIYIVHAGEYEVREIVTVFMDQDKAKEFVDVYNINRTGSHQADYEAQPVRDGEAWLAQYDVRIR